MARAIVLDSGPLGLLTYSRASEQATGCNLWLHELANNGHTVVLPEIIDFELRRELLRLALTKGLLRLETLRTIRGVRFEPITNAAMRLAAEFWAQTRRRGRPTAGSKELDIDMILAAQTTLMARAGFDVVVATANQFHLAPFVPSAQWSAIPT